MENKEIDQSIFDFNMYSVLAPSEYELEGAHEQHQEAKEDLWAAFAEGLDFDEVLSVVKENLTEEFRADPYKMQDVAQNDILEVLADYFGDTDEKTHKRLELKPTDEFIQPLKPASITEHKESSLNGIHIMSDGTNVIARWHNGSQVIGKTKKPIDKIWVPSDKYITRAATLGDVAQIKGTCLGYSNLVHSACALAIYSKAGLMEPIEGHDVIAHGYKWEITGKNWKKRKSDADIVICKYELISLVGLHDQDDLRIMKYSQLEDGYNSVLFVDSNLDKERSPYTPYVERLHNLDLHLGPKHYRLFYEHYRYWLSKRDPIKSPIYEEKLDATGLRELLCVRSKNSMLPAPFRVLAGRPADPTYMSGLQIQPQVSAGAVRTTYHTWPHQNDPTREFFKKPANKVQAPTGIHRSKIDLAYQSLLKFNMIQSIYIESELSAKVHGKNGCFWSKWSNTGIAWKTVNAKSLTYYACYYRVSKPPSTCGEWSCIDEIRDIWRGPTFKMSIQQLQYNTTLIHKFYALISSLPAYTRGGEFKQALRACIIAFSMLRGSTWQTSSIASDFRFITTCSISRSGNIQSMLDKIPPKVTNFLSFPDSMVIRTLIKMTEKNLRDRSNKTPLFGLPLRFMALEKDLTQGMCWHMREANHANNCMAKVIKGIREENEHRQTRIDAYVAQDKFICKFLNRKITTDEFADFMDEMPDIPYYNHVIFSGLAWKSAKDLHAGKRQRPTPIQLSRLITDHNATTINYAEIPTVTSNRVADGFVRLMSETNHPPSVHHLISRMTEQEYKEDIYSIHPKDSRDKDREIPQMSNYMRPKQFMSESLITIYTDAEPNDMMQKSSKFPTFVSRFSRILKPIQVNGKTRSYGLSRSEDKSFFCGHMHPEFMSLATQVVAKVTHTTSLITAAALQRIDRVRYTIIPWEADPEILDGLGGVRDVKLVRQGKTKVTKMVPMYIHMMQGVRALGAALINTCFSTGLDELTKEILPTIEETCVLLTSDDSARAARVTPGATSKSVLQDYVNIPPEQVVHCMMKDSAAKAIESHRIAEFNNFATSPQGAYPQVFSHAFLCVQPLLGDTLLDDIMSCTSNARMSITWGDSIDMSRAAFYGNVIMLMQKWLITPEELNFLTDAGLFPKSDEQLISGFYIRNKALQDGLWNGMDEEHKRLLSTGEITLASALRAFRLSQALKRSVRLVKYPQGTSTVRRNLTMINAARRIKGRGIMRVKRPYNPSRRNLIKNMFMSFVSKAQSANVDNPPNFPPELKVVINTSPHMRYDRMPCVQGSAVGMSKIYNLKGILAKRYFDVNASQLLDEDEQKIVSLSEDDFDKWLVRYKSKSAYVGLKHKSPSGRPLVRMHNNTWFTLPRTFGFTVILPDPVNFPSTFTVAGRQFPNVQTCIYGENSLNRARTKGCMLAFGYSILANSMAIFYQPIKSHVRVAIVNKTRSAAKIIKVREGRVYIRLRPDWTTITLPFFGVDDPLPDRNWLVGQPTARMNYGSWISTSASSACAASRKLFSKFGCSSPFTFDRFKPRFPLFSPDAVEIPMAQYVRLHGISSVRKLKLIHVENPLPSQVVYLHGPIPVTEYERPNLEEEESEEETE